jgi:ABC-type glycerol-3-phosphate transport system substrate-binding protein
MLPTTSRREVLRFALVGAGAATLAACGATPTPEVVEKQVVVTQVVEKEVTTIVEGTPQVVKETVVVEKVVEATAAPEQKHDISFAWWTGGEGANKVFHEAIDRFELSHPNFSVNRIAIPGGEWATKILTMYGSGNAPDCHGVWYGTVWAWAHKGVLLDLTPLVERDAAEIRWDEMWPAVTGGCYYPVGEKITALPRETFGLRLFGYNIDIFEAAGEDTPDKDYDAGNWTWDLWRDKAAKLTKFGADDRREILGASQGVGYWDLQIIMNSLGVKMFNDDLTHFNLDDPAVVDYLKMLADMMLTDRSLAKPDETKEFDWASSGKQAIIGTATWGIPNQRTAWADFKWDFVPPPKGSCCHTNFVGNDYHAVNASSYADQEGGWELIKFLNSEKEDLWWGLNMFGPPFRKPNLEKWTSQVSELVPMNGWKYVPEMTEQAIPWTPIPFQDELDTIHNNEIGQAVDGERPVDEVVSSIVTKVDEMIAAFK